uniref:Uncharacterized protein n=1 Tax=Rhizophora mucronata TaxID=61149 RepID=A0A2P2Q410_RHIMU
MQQKKIHQKDQQTMEWNAVIGNPQLSTSHIMHQNIWQLNLVTPDGPKDFLGDNFQKHDPRII